MVFTKSDVENIIDSNNVLIGDNVIADIDFTDSYEVFVLTMNQELSYSRVFDTIDEVVDFLNELENIQISKTSCLLDSKGSHILQTMSEYYFENQNRKHRTHYFWDLLKQVYNYVNGDIPCTMTQTDYDNLLVWFNKALNDYKLQDKYWFHANGDQQLS